MNVMKYVIYLLIIAGTTYLIRALPFALVKRKIKNPYLKSFLNFIPYAVLAAMTFPAILYSTTYVLTALVGFIVAVLFSYFRQSMVKVAIAACVTVYVVELLLVL